MTMVSDGVNFTFFVGGEIEEDSLLCVETSNKSSIEPLVSHVAVLNHMRSEP